MKERHRWRKGGGKERLNGGEKERRGSTTVKERIGEERKGSSMIKRGGERTKVGLAMVKKGGEKLGGSKKRGEARW